MKQFEVDGYTIEPFLDGKIIRHKVLIKGEYTILKKTWCHKELYDDLVRLFPDDTDSMYQEVISIGFKKELASIL
jgi:hypothetical protein